jgi:hypothetical protein
MRRGHAEGKGKGHAEGVGKGKGKGEGEGKGESFEFRLSNRGISGIRSKGSKRSNGSKGVLSPRITKESE